MKFNRIIILHRHALLAPNSLAVNHITKEDRGLYQCLVNNVKSSAQASAELKLGGKYHFRIHYYCNALSL